MRLRVVALAALTALGLVGAGCSVGPRPGQAPEGGGQERREGVLLLAADADGAVLLDRGAAAFVGVSRSGARVWSDTHGPQHGATVVCLVRCPEAVVSGTLTVDAPSPAPRRFGVGGVRSFPVPAAYRRRVVSARSAGEAVVEEGGADGRSWLRIVRDGDDQRIEVPGAAQLWAESPDGSVALSFARASDAVRARLRWFVRDAGGWRLVDDRMPRRRAWEACLADGGEVAVLTGRDAALVLGRRRRVQLRIDLPAAGECGVGRHGGAVLQRSVNGQGARRTAVRGFGLDGAQRWARDYATEAFVAVDPAGEHAAIVHDGVLEIVDRAGATLSTRPEVQAARFTAAGELVVVTLDGQVRWLPPAVLAVRG